MVSFARYYYWSLSPTGLGSSLIHTTLGGRDSLPGTKKSLIYQWMCVSPLDSVSEVATCPLQLDMFAHRGWFGFGLFCYSF